MQLAVAGWGEADVDPLRVLWGKRPGHELGGQGPEGIGPDPVGGPLLAGVRGPGHGSAEAVLPLREEWVVARR